MRKIGRKLLIAVLASTLIVTPVYADPTVDELQSEKAASQEELQALQDELTTLLDNMNILEEGLIVKGNEITVATKDLERSIKIEQKQLEDMILRIQFMYEGGGDTSILDSLLSSESFTEFINKAEYVQNVHTYDRDMLEEYIRTKEKIANLKTTLEAEQAKMEELQDEYYEKEDEINTLVSEKKDEIAGFDEQIQAAAERAAAAAAARAAEAARVAAAQSQSGATANNGGNTQSQTPVSDSNGGQTNTGNENTNSNTNNDTDDNNSTPAPTPPPVLADPGGNASVGQAIVNAAYGYSGVPYVWGGESYNGVDCSGLVLLAHRAVGIGLAHSSGSIGGGGKAVSNPQPGDVVCYSGHVGIYVGGGAMIHAPQTGDVVRVVGVYGSPWYRRYW